MSLENPTDWQKIFNKTRHEFTEDEIEDALHTDRGPLAQFKPKFWDEYKPMGRNSKHLEDIWEREYLWAVNVQKGNFRIAKRLFRELKNVKI